MLLALTAYRTLIAFDRHLAREDFAAFCNRVRRYPVGPEARSPVPIDRICGAVDMASIWYWKPVPCLQRSAATACLLRQHGVAAQMVIGAQAMPFRAHAWVEVDGHVVNDKPYMPEIYAVLERC